MKKVFHKISSVYLALIVLLSTVSFTIDSHYCGDTLVDSSLFGHVETCGMDKQLSRNDCQSEVQDDSCCSDKQLVVEGQDDLKMSFNTLNFDIVPFRDYTPPYLVRNVQKLHETYLI